MKRFLLFFAAVFIALSAYCETIEYIRTKTIDQYGEHPSQSNVINFRFERDRIYLPTSMFGYKYSYTDSYGNAIYYAVGQNVGSYASVSEFINKDCYLIVSGDKSYINEVFALPGRPKTTCVYQRYVREAPGPMQH